MTGGRNSLGTRSSVEHVIGVICLHALAAIKVVLQHNLEPGEPICDELRDKSVLSLV